MHPEQYEDRKRYINAIKNSFATSGQPLNANEQAGDNNRSEKVPHSFLGVRFFLALCLFLAFFLSMALNIAIIRKFVFDQL